MNSVKTAKDEFQLARSEFPGSSTGESLIELQLAVRREVSDFERVTLTFIGGINSACKLMDF